jgi:hypothetical protein
MTTTNTPRGQSADEGRPHAVRRAEEGADAWRQVVHAQRPASPDHTDFYALAGEMVETLRVLDSLAGLMSGQVAGYSNGRDVYDDDGGTPAHRLRAAVLALAETRHGIAVAERAANRFWSAIGHIGFRCSDEDGGRS